MLDILLLSDIMHNYNQLQKNNQATQVKKKKKSLELDCTQGEAVFNNYELWVSENKIVWQNEKCKASTLHKTVIDILCKK